MSVRVRSGSAGGAGRASPPLEVPGGAATQRARRYWDTRAARYDKMIDRMERALLGDGRAWVCSQATGEVLEVAIGTGRNLGFYPPDVHLAGLDYRVIERLAARKPASHSPAST